MTSSIPPEYTRRIVAKALAWVPVLFGLAGGLWLLHTQSVAHAEWVAMAEVRISQVESRLGKIDTIADDVAEIKAALGVEQGWRRGLLQSLPGAEGGQ